MDYYLFRLINDLAGKNNLLDILAVFFGDYFTYLLTAAVLAFFLAQKKFDLKEKIAAAAAAFLGAGLARLILVEIIRWLYFRPRPFADHAVNLLIFHENSGSFPSGHATFFFALAAAIYFIDKKWGIVFGAAALVMCLARVFAGIHYPADILAGAVLGILCGWISMVVFKKFFSFERAERA